MTTYLTQEELQQLIQAAVDTGLTTPDARADLLEGIHRGWVASLPACSSPLDQFRSDLAALNNAPCLTGSTEVPLITWLRNAVHRLQLTAMPQSALFQQRLAEVTAKSATVIANAPGVQPTAGAHQTPEPPPLAAAQPEPSPALRMARRALEILEQQAAAYTNLTIPVHLQIELEEKRREVAALEAREGVPPTHPPAASTTIIIQGDGNIVGNGNTVAVQKGADAPPPATPVPGPAAALPATFRTRLQRLDAVEIESLCLDHFPAVYDKFTRGLRRDEMINLLLDHCRRHPDAAALLHTLLP